MGARQLPSRRFIALISMAVMALAGCGSDAAAPEEAVPTPDPGEAIYSLAIDPADGTLLAATGPGFYRLPGDTGKPERLTAQLSSPQGNGPVKDLVVRFTGGRTLIGSGHAAEPPMPTNVGLVRSTDQGKTWQVVSGQGEADYHEIEVVGERIFGLRTDGAGLVQVSTDGGRTFETRQAPTGSTPVDIAVNPADPTHWAMSNDSGTFISTNEGRSWRQRSTTPRPRLVWPAPDALYGVGLDGTVRHSPDGGRTWQEKGSLGAGPKELIAAPDGGLYAVTTGGQIHRSGDGGATWSKVAQVS